MTYRILLLYNGDARDRYICGWGGAGSDDDQHTLPVAIDRSGSIEHRFGTTCSARRLKLKNRVSSATHRPLALPHTYLVRREETAAADHRVHVLLHLVVRHGAAALALEVVAHGAKGLELAAAAPALAVVEGLVVCGRRVSALIAAFRFPLTRSTPQVLVERAKRPELALAIVALVSAAVPRVLVGCVRDLGVLDDSVREPVVRVELTHEAVHAHAVEVRRAGARAALEVVRESGRGHKVALAERARERVGAVRARVEVLVGSVSTAGAGAHRGGDHSPGAGCCCC